MPEVKVPELAESITEGTIAEWLKNVGDSVDKGEAILELETDKVNVEVVSEEAGVLSEQLAEEGDTVEVGQAVAVVGEGSGNASSGSSEDTPQKMNLKMQDKLKINQNKNKLLQIINKIAKILTINVSMLRHLHVDMHVKMALT